MVMGDMRLVRNMYWVWVLGWLFASPCFADIELIGKVTHPAISEMSGIVRSSYPGVFWVHNDSGDSARLFAITPDAQVITPRWVNSSRVAQWEGHAIDNAWHNDWEAIAMDADAGVLYLADVGNNDNARRDLGVYVVDEPNPRYVNRARSKFSADSIPRSNEVPCRTVAFRLRGGVHLRRQALLSDQTS